MGAMKNGEQDRKDALRAKRNRLRRTDRGEGAVASWSGAADDLVAMLVCVVTCCGGSVQFGMTLDRGAASLAFYMDGQREVVYYQSYIQLDEELRGWVQHFLNILEEEPELLEKCSVEAQNDLRRRVEAF